MKDSVIIIIILFFTGSLFSFLAKKYNKNKIKYFFIGILSFLIIHIIYMILFGLINGFKVSEELNIHRKYSMILSFSFSYISYKLLKSRLDKEKESESSEIQDIGK